MGHPLPLWSTQLLACVEIRKYQQTALKPEYNLNYKCNTVIMAQYSV